MAEAMHVPTAETREQIWQNAEPSFKQGLDDAYKKGLLLRSPDKRTRNMQAAFLMDLVKMSYLLGLDRGYDMGYHVFSPDA